MADLSALSDAELEAIVSRGQSAATSSTAMPTPIEATPDSWYAPKQLGFDLLAGLARAGYGVADLVTTPIVFLANQESADLPYFGLSKMGAEDINAAAKILGVNPDSAIQEAVSFAAPTPLSKAKVGSQILSGLGSYLGYKGVENITGSEIAGALGGVLAPGMASKGASTYGTAIKALAGNEDAIRQLAQKEILSAAGQEGAERLRLAQEIPALGVGAGNVPLTAAEIAQSPALAAYQQQARLGTQGKQVLEPAIQQRELEIAAALNRNVGEQAQVGELSLALRGFADAAERAKLNKENELLMSVMPAEELAGMSRLQRGEALSQSLMSRSEASDAAIKNAWEAVPQKTKIAAGNTILNALREFNTFGKIAKQRISGTGSAVISTLKEYSQKAKAAQANDKPFNLTVKQLQDLRSFAGVAGREAQGVNPREVAMMTNLKNSLDKIGLQQAQTETATSAVAALKNAIEVTAKEKELFTRGVTGELLKTRSFQPQIKVSQWVDKILSSPENITELGTKFGKQSPELTQVRAELLDRLSSSENPQSFLNKNKDLFNQAFEDDVIAIEQYAFSKATGTGLEGFKNITDTVVPSRVFANSQSAKDFASKFANTPVLDWTRRKFIDQKIVRGDVLTNLERNRDIAKELFGDSYSSVKRVLNDLAISKSPAELERLASKGQSITGQRLTAIGQLASFRGTLQGMEKGSIPLMTALGFGQGGFGAAVGAAGGLVARQVSLMRQDTLNKFVAEMLANPQTLEFAAAVPTQSNMQQLIDAGIKAGYFRALGENGKPIDTETMMPDAVARTTNNVQQMSDQELQDIVNRRKVTATPTAFKTADSQAISALIADKPPIIKAIAWQESRYNPKAESGVGAKGLMQLMPKTAEALGVKDAFNPTENLEAGERYYNQLLKRFKKPEFALAAYNWGEGNVSKALTRLRKNELALTWDNLLLHAAVPKETRSYVKSVLNKAKEFEV